MKINRTPINPLTRDRTEDAADIFFRGEHPDTRSDKEFIQSLQKRGIERVSRPQEKIPVRCVNTGEVFPSLSLAERKFGLSKGAIFEYLNRGRKFRYRKDLKFELV